MGKRPMNMGKRTKSNRNSYDSSQTSIKVFLTRTKKRSPVNKTIKGGMFNLMYPSSNKRRSRNKKIKNVR